MAMGTTVFRIRIALIFRRCGNLITPSRSCRETLRPMLGAEAIADVYKSESPVWGKRGFLMEDAKPAIGNIPSEAQIKAGTFTPGSPWTICITPGPNQVLYSTDAWPGRIYKLSLDGKLLGMLGQSGKQLKQFGWIHALACPSENVLWVGELLNWRAQKLILHP